MKNINRLNLKLDIIEKIVLIIVFWGLFFPDRAEAYFDPYSGGFLFQLIIGGVAGLVTIYKFYGDKIRKFINHFKKNND